LNTFFSSPASKIKKMASIQTNVLPKSYTLPAASKISIAGPSSRRLLPVGPAFVSHLRLTLHHGHSFEAHDAQIEKERQRLEELENSAANGEDDLGVGDEPESDELLNLDPKEWKAGYTFCTLPTLFLI
jgi:hypothetical protein